MGFLVVVVVVSISLTSHIYRAGFLEGIYVPAISVL